MAHLASNSRAGYRHTRPTMGVQFLLAIGCTNEDAFPMTWRVPTRIPLPPEFIGFAPADSLPTPGFTSYERHLPHWRIPGACYFVTFRLDDSLPRNIEIDMRREKEAWRQRLAQAVARHEGRLPPDEVAAWEAFQRAQLRKLEGLLDEGHGECLLRHPSDRECVQKALLHFEGTRSEMIAFVIMPNHVHLACRPLAPHALEELCASWKWYSAQQIQRRRARVGSLWQEENFDRLIRDAEHLTNVTRYIARNPIKAALSEDDACVWFSKDIHAANGWPSRP